MPRSRRVTVTNHGARRPTLEVTSYAEVSLNYRRADQAHPAFAKLFLETEHCPEPPALLRRRRPRARDQKPVWAMHVLASPQSELIEYRDRPRQFLARASLRRAPQLLSLRACCRGQVRPALNPIFSLRCKLRLEPGASSTLAFSTAAAADRVEGTASRAPLQRLVRGLAHVRAGEDAHRRRPVCARHHHRGCREIPEAGVLRALRSAGAAVT